jgi:hypothetical protein
VTVKFPKDKTLTIGHDDGNHRGRLDAKGVTFTSLTTEGWNGIVIQNSAVDDSTYFSNSTIENSVTGVELQNARPLIEKSTFRFNNTGIYLNDASNDYAIGGADSRTNHFYNNFTLALINTGSDSLDATYNNWGTSSGPRHADNPGGKGDSIVGPVKYKPWRVAQAVENFTITEGLFGITLSWSASTTPNLTAYNIYRSLSQTAAVFYDSVTATVNTFVDKNLERGKTYYYWVAPVDADGVGMYSSRISGGITPFNLTISYPVIDVDSVKVAWQAHADASVVYNFVYMGSHRDSTVLVDSLVRDSTSYTFKNLKEGQEYYFKFKARNSANSFTSFTDLDSVITRLIKPTDFTATTASVLSQNSINLSWKDNTNLEAGYIIEQTAEGISSWQKVDTVGINEQGAIAGDLEPATAYSFRLYAYSAQGAISDYSNTATDTTERDPNIPHGKILAVAGLEGFKSDTVTIQYELKLDTGKNCQTMDWSYSLNGTDWVPLEASDILSNTPRAPGQHQIEWLTLTKLNGVDDESVWFRMKYTDNEFTSSWIYSPLFHIDNNLPPSASILPVIGELTGDVTIQYTTEDAEGDNISLTGEFSTDEGTNWAVATIEYTGESASSKAAFATITLTGIPALDQTITIISTDGTSVTYTAKNENNYASNEFEHSTIHQNAATNLGNAIGNVAGHGSKITQVTYLDFSFSTVTLTQATTGAAGNTTITETMDNVTSTNFTGGLSGEISGNIIWKAKGDLASGFEGDVSFRVTPADKDPGYPSSPINVQVDYNQPPTVALSTISSPQVSDVQIGYTIIDLEEDTIRLEAKYNLGGGWKAATVKEDITSITAYSGVMTWESMEDADPILYTSVHFQLTPHDHDPGVSFTSNVFQLDNDQLPKANVLTISGEQSKDIQVIYTLSDKQKDDISFLPQYSVNQGATWIEATIVGQKENITMADTALQDTFIWKSYTDLPEKDIDPLYLRIIPSDINGNGFSRTTAIFHLDNNTPPTVILSELAGEQSGNINITYKITDLSESDNIDLSGQFSSDRGVTWSSAVFPVAMTSVIPSAYDGSFKWDSKAQTEGIDQQQFQLIIKPSDIDPGTADTIVFHLDNEVGPTLVSFNEKFTPVPGDPLRLEFSRSIQRSSVLGAVQVLSDASGSLNDLIFTYENDDKIINVFSANGIPAMDKLTVTIENELKDTDGKGFDGNQNGDPEYSIIDDTTFTVETYLGADFDRSGKIGQNDISILVNAWISDNFDYEIGPATGTLPNLRSKPDLQYNIDDFMTFIRYWNWAKANNIIGRIITGTFDDQNIDIVSEGSKILIQPLTPMAITDFHVSINEYDPMVQFLEPELNQGINDNSKSVLMVSAIDTSMHYYDVFMGFIESTAAVKTDSNLFIIPVKVRGRNKQNVEIMYEYMIDGQHYTGKRLVEVEPIPEKYALGQNFPNPFNPITTIFYDLPVDGKIELIIYDILGRKVITLISGFQEKGYKTVQWKGLDQNGIKVSSGIYFYRLLSEDYMASKKMILLK